MANIKVHLLNFHYIFSHIEIMLENTSTTPHTYYQINRWTCPWKRWSNTSYLDSGIALSYSLYSFEIQADPEEITRKWASYFFETEHEASILTKNCAVAAQWFLSEFANMPEPNQSNLSWNHLGLGVMWPSPVPCPVSLPGRIMSNAKFHNEIRNSTVNHRIYYYINLAVATLLLTGSIIAIIIASSLFNQGLALGAATAGLASCHFFFKAYNHKSANHIKQQATNAQPVLQV